MSVSVTQHKMFVGGEWVESSSGETMEVLNPATGEVIAEVPRGTAEDVERAVSAAKKAWVEWQDKTPKDRMELLLALADVIDENAEELARLESQNVGKPWWVAVDEPGIMSDNLRFFAGAARNLEGKAAGEYAAGYTSMIRREPLGIVAGICPWNYPLFMAVWKMGPALAAGNVQIIKPAEQTPLTMLRFVELAQEVLPPGVLQVVTGDGVPGRRRPRQAPGDLARLAHGRHGHGQADRQERRRYGEARPPGARRQGAHGRARRRRSGHGRRGDQDRRLLQLRAGLHRLFADPGQRADLRRRRRQVDRGCRVADRRRPGHRRRDRHGPRHLGRAAGARARFPRRVQSTRRRPC